ncbi:MAG: hypothetical protein B7C24_10575 [Bacteroidetes bacterium 4572_77]|nr:MAG: hypothetical protein B7C24_10575 [Bacteroidetes bacterium 4572_77]
MKKEPVKTIAGFKILVWGVGALSRNRTLPIEITIGNGYTDVGKAVFDFDGKFKFKFDLPSNASPANTLKIRYVDCVNGEPEFFIIYEGIINDILDYKPNLYINQAPNFIIKTLAVQLDNAAQISLNGKSDTPTIIPPDGATHTVDTDIVGLIQIDDNGTPAPNPTILNTSGTLNPSYVIVLNPTDSDVNAFQNVVNPQSFRMLIYNGSGWHFAVNPVPTNPVPIT